MDLESEPYQGFPFFTPQPHVLKLLVSHFLNPICFAHPGDKMNCLCTLGREIKANLEILFNKWISGYQAADEDGV